MVKTLELEQLFEEHELGKYDAKATVMTVCGAIATDDQHHHVLDELYPRQDKDWSDVEIFYNIDLVFLSKPSQYQKTTPPAAGTPDKILCSPAHLQAVTPHTHGTQVYEHSCCW